MKRFFTAAMASVMVFTLGACSGSATSSGDASSQGAASAESKSDTLLKDTSNAKKLTREGGEVYPNRQVEIIIPLAAGGGTDIFIRRMAPIMSEIMGVPVTVTNITGSSGLKGIGTVMQAEPDGYTLTAFNPPSQPLSQMTLKPDFDMRDLTPLSYYAYDAITCFAHPDLPYNTWEELYKAIADGELDTIATTGLGSIDDITVKAIMKNTGFNPANIIRYNGSGEAIAALMKKEVMVAFAPAGSSLTQLAEGSLKAILVCTKSRFPALGDVPAWGDDLGQESIDFVSTQNRIIAAPPKLPGDIAAYLEEVIEEVCKDEDLVAWAAQQGLPVLGLGREDARRVLDDSFKIADIVDLEELNAQ